MSTTTHTRKAATENRDEYLNLVKRFPPRPIHNEAQYDATVEVMHKLAVRDEGTLSEAENDYLLALTRFVDDYDREHYLGERRRRSRKQPLRMPGNWRAGLRCWIEREGKIVMGIGRADLLERIDRSRSIRSAARDMGMSYRRAWLLVQSVNRGAGEPLVETATGGKRGGGAVLTMKGRELVALFRQLNHQLHETASESLRSLLNKKANPQKPAARRKSATPRGK